MQEYGGASSKQGEYHDGEGRERTDYQSYVMQQKNYGCSSKDISDPNLATYCRVASSIYEATSSNQQYQNQRYHSSAPTFSSPPNSPLVGLVFDPSTSYGGPGIMGGRNGSDQRPQNWSSQEPIGTGAKKKIVKSQEKRNVYSSDPRYHDKYKDFVDSDRQKKQDMNLTSESTSSFDFFAEGERMVSELCNISDSRSDANNQKQNPKFTNQEEDKCKSSASNSSELLLSVLDKIVIHDQIPNQIVQLAIEACTDAENIAIAHHNRPCFKNIHSICAKTRSNVQKPDSAVANLHSQGIPWVIKNFIFSFVRILDGWKGVKELLSEKHDTFSRIENKYYSPDIRECFVQWQAVTKEMLTHIYKTFKCLDHGFTMEQKSFTHNYYATNSAAPRHQNLNKLPTKSNLNATKSVNVSPQPCNAMQPPWMQSQSTSQSYNEVPWPVRPGIAYKKYPVAPPPSSHSYYPLNDQSDLETYQKLQHKCDPCVIREAKPRQSWTISNVPDFRALESMCHTDQRELYNQLKIKMDAELGKASGQPVQGNIPCDLLQRRDMELKAKMIPLSHVEKSLIPSMATAADMRGYVQKNNSCGDTKEEADFFAAWGQMVQKEQNEFLTHHNHNVTPSNIVISNNISGPVQFVDVEHDEFHEMSKVYMKPGSYKVPIKPSDPFVANVAQENVSPFENIVTVDLNIKTEISPITLAPQPKYNLESWPCLARRSEEIYSDDPKLIPRQGIPCLDIRASEPFDLFGAITQDRAWEAAKQSAPKLVDFIHDGSKSDTARLYDALGLNTTDELSEDLKQIKLGFDHNNAWTMGLTPNQQQQFISKDLTSIWNQNANKNDYLVATQAQSVADPKQLNLEEQLETPDAKSEVKENKRGPNFDHSGNCVRDDSQKKPKSKTTVSGMWYHPKKKKPLPSHVIKKFENIIQRISQINESTFIQQDMDIKVAPRFYEVVKYPMCLHDISTKLKNSSYNEYEQVVQDFRRIFNNVRLYLKSCPDLSMKKNVNKVANEFEKILNEEFQSKGEPKTKSQDAPETQESGHKKDVKGSDAKNDETTKKNESKNNIDDKK